MKINPYYDYFYRDDFTARRLQVGTPAQIVNHPATEFVAEFVDGIDLKRIDTVADSGTARQAHRLKVVSSGLAHP